MKILDENGLEVKRGDEKFEELLISNQEPFLFLGTEIKGKKNNYIVVGRLLDASNPDPFYENSKWDITLKIN